MSIKVMSAVWEIEGIDSSECLVLMALADHADDNGRCYPSIARLAKRTKLSDRGVQKVISRLVEKGFVTIVPAAGQGGANVYIVTATPSVPVVAVAPDASSRDVDAQLRWRVYKRDAYSCRYCGFQGHEDGHNLTVDHIVPVSKGGTNAESNLNTCCFSCNSSKKNKDLDAWLEHRVNHVHPEPRSPRTTGTTPPNDVRKTPEPRSPKPSRTTNEPSLPEANASGRDTASEAERKKEFWDQARAYLRSRKVPEGQIGSFVAKCVREHGLTKAREAFDAAGREQAAEPIPFISACLNKPKHEPAITENVIRLAMQHIEAREQARAAR